MNRIKIVVYTALAVVVFIPVQSLYAQSSSDTVAAITKLENDSVKADLAADTSWAEKFLDTKNNNFKSEKLTDLKVRVYGNTAVATYKDTYDAMVQGQHRARSVASTDVWVKTGSDWKLVSSQGTTAK